MNIYFAGSLNSDFISSLATGLNALGLNIIEANKLFIKREVPKGEIIHIHWPEAYFPKGCANDKNIYSDYLNALKFYKNRNPIYFTIHNLIPHDGNKKLSYQLYASTIQYSTALIHLGPYSVEIVKQTYVEAKQKKHIIIPHHILPVPINIPDKKEARSSLNLPQDKYILASIGDLRYKEDVEEMWQHYEEMKASKDCFLFMHKYRNLVNRYFISNLIKYPSLTIKELQHRFFNPDVKFNTSSIPLEKLCTYISAADIILLPRTQNLNSGVPFLVCNYNKPILSNASGNIGWSLEQLNYKKEKEIYEADPTKSYAEYNKRIFTSLQDIYFSLSGSK